jgi:hypothetical protein
VPPLRACSLTAGAASGSSSWRARVSTREYTPRDVAAVVGRIVGKPIDVQQAPEEAMAPALIGAGMNAEWARLFQELTHGLNANIVVWEGGHSFWRGETDLQTVLSTLLGR